jgi:hypothetical protein
MTKFIACEDGSYTRLDFITDISVEGSTTFFILAYSEENEYKLCSGFKTEEQAQDWLDNFMIKHGLCIETITPSRCF